MTNKHDHTPTITLAGREWEIPKLAVRQNRIVVPALLDLVPKLRRAPDAPLDVFSYDRLADAVYAALTRAQPQLARAEFDEMAIGAHEMLAALRVIALQAGLLADAGERG